MRAFLNAKYRKAITRSISVAPFVLGSLSALIAIGVVRLFQLSSSIITEENIQGISSDTDNTIAVLLGMLFATELGTRLFAVSNAKYTMRLLSYLMTKDNVDCLNAMNKNTAVRTNFVASNCSLDRSDPHTVNFLTALYTSASYTLIKNEIHLRWVLLDVVIIYHVLLKPYTLATIALDNNQIFMAVFSGSYVHYFVVMLMFSTADSVSQMFELDPISDRIDMAALTMYDHLEKYSPSPATVSVKRPVVDWLMNH